MTVWTTPAGIRARVRRRWDDGSLLRAYAADLPVPVIDVALRAPKAREIGDDVAAVRAWVADLEQGRRGDAHYTLAYRSVGGRLIGRNEVPSRALVSTYEQAWALLGVSRDVRALDAVLEMSAEPAARSWAAAHPLQALRLREQWPAVLAAYRWLDRARGSGLYLRQITAPGVDTKFVEQHRGVLAALLGVPGSTAGFLDALGLMAKPEVLRVRGLPGVGPLTEVSARVAELAELPVAPRIAVIVENEITYLSVPVPQDGIVVWGKGFDVGRVGGLPWLQDAQVVYWGDIDTHGFAILNQVRAAVAHTASLLMDRATLLAHHERWVSEPSPTTARLDRLDAAERALYEELVSDRLGPRVRLEQERVDWAWATDRLPL